MSTKNGCNIHHVVPTTRGGRRVPDNELVIPVQVHNAYNLLFANSKPDEAVERLLEIYEGLSILTLAFNSKKKIVKNPVIQLKIITGRYAPGYGNRDSGVDRRIIKRAEAWQRLFGRNQPSEAAIFIVEKLTTERWREDNGSWISYIYANIFENRGYWNAMISDSNLSYPRLVPVRKLEPIILG